MVGSYEEVEDLVMVDSVLLTDDVQDGRSGDLGAIEDPCRC